MKITDNVHLIRKEFQVTPVVKRYVNIYLIEGKAGCYLIDSGVAGTEVLVAEYMNSIGKTMSDISGMFLTHSHPDHIGAANQIKIQSKCKVYAPKKELSWIENIDNQFKDRPIPNFYTLLNESVKVDVAVEGGEVFEPEEGIRISCVETIGHSHGSMSYLLNDEIMFIGDAIPVVNDLPIFVDYGATIDTITRLRGMDNVKRFCPAWDDVYDKAQFDSTTTASLAMLDKLKNVVLEVNENNPDISLPEQINMILENANLIQFAGNPLVAKSIESIKQS